MRDRWQRAERQRGRRHCVQTHAQRPNIGRRADVGAFVHFRSRVVRTAAASCQLIFVGAAYVCKCEVDQATVTCVCARARTPALRAYRICRT
jgi:hypothetical protein